jgi:hypothetical protein
LIQASEQAIRPGSKEVLRRFFRAAIPPRIRSFSEWLQRELIVPSGPFAGQRVSFSSQPWVRLFAAEVDSGRWHHFRSTGPVQSGKSLICYVGLMLYHLCEVGEKVICGIPSLDMVETKWSEDIRPALMAGRYARLVPTTGKGSRGGTPGRISLGNAAVLQFMAGGGNDKQRAGATTRVMCITETDGMDDVGGTSDEGTKIDQLLGRVRAYGDRAVTYCECSVSHSKGFIWTEYKAGTASKIACPCPHCGEYITPERKDFLGWQDADNAMDAGELARFVCYECGGMIDDKQRREMNENAVLVHRGQSVVDGKVVGDPPKTDTLGFRWSAFNNMFASISQLGREEWKAAQAENQDATQTTRKQQVWCEPSEADEAETVELSRGIVRGSAKGYAGRCNGVSAGEWPSGTTRRVAFVDIGKRFLPWMLLGTDGHSVHVSNYGEHETERPEVVGDEQAIEQALRELLPSLQSQGIDLGFVDCANWTDLIKRVVSEFGLPWICSHGFGDGQFKPATETTKTKIRNEHSSRWYIARDGRVRVVNMDSDYWKHQVHSRLVIQPLTNGETTRDAITFCGENPMDHDGLASQLLAEEWRRVFKEGRGYKEAWYKKTKNNHGFDLLYGGLVALDCAAAMDDETATETPQPHFSGVRRTPSSWIRRTN